MKRTTCRACLTRNKIFFETVAAVLLSGMAIAISVLQMCSTSEQTALMKQQTATSLAQYNATVSSDSIQRIIAEKQTGLLDQQTRIAENMLSHTTLQDSISILAYQSRLLKSIRRIWEFVRKKGTKELYDLSADSLYSVLQQIREIVEFESENPVILRHPLFRKNWMDARAEVNSAALFFNPERAWTLETVAKILGRVIERAIATGLNVGLIRNVDRKSLDTLMSLPY